MGTITARVRIGGEGGTIGTHRHQRGVHGANLRGIGERFVIRPIHHARGANVPRNDTDAAANAERAARGREGRVLRRRCLGGHLSLSGGESTGGGLHGEVRGGHGGVRGSRGRLRHARRTVEPSGKPRGRVRDLERRRKHRIHRKLRHGPCARSAAGDANGVASRRDG